MNASIPVCFLPMPPWCDRAEAVMGTVWRYPSVCHTGAPLGMGIGRIWLGMFP